MCDEAAVARDLLPDTQAFTVQVEVCLAYQAFAFQCWCLAESCLQLCDIGLVMLVMMYLHCCGVDVWLQCICREWQWGQFIERNCS